MSGHISDGGRQRRGRGKGEGADYEPWIKARDFHNQGTASVINDWKTGRRVHLLSQGEKYAYYLLRWDDHVIDIREQYPLDLEATVKIAKTYGLRHPKNEQTRMTTDLLVSYRYDDGNETLHAYSIKPRRKDIEETSANKTKAERQARCIEKLYIEQSYWHLKGVPYTLWFKDEMNRTLAENIAFIVAYYDFSEVQDRQSMLMYLLAHKIISIDMESAPVVSKIPKLMDEYFGDSQKWLELLTEDQKKMVGRCI